MILETNGPSNSSIYIFWLMAPFDFRRTIFFYSSSTPRTKGKIKSQKSHIENQFIEIIKKWHDFGVKIPKNLNALAREKLILAENTNFGMKIFRMKVLIGLIGLINANLYDQKNIGIRAGNSEPWRHVGRQDKKNTEFGKRFETSHFCSKMHHWQYLGCGTRKFVVNWLIYFFFQLYLTDWTFEITNFGHINHFGAQNPKIICFKLFYWNT